MNKTEQPKTAKKQSRQEQNHFLPKLITIGLICVVCVGLTACNGNRATPTALPASIARPEQPTPVYGESTNFTLATVEPVLAEPHALSAALAATAPLTQTVTTTASTPQPASTPLSQTPTALGIVRGGAVLLATPNGRALSNLPAGATVTITGKTADGRYLAVYTEQGNAGWIATGQLTLFGDADLVVVPVTSGPGLIATLLAEAMQPMTITLSSVLSATSDLTLPIDTP